MEVIKPSWVKHHDDKNRRQCIFSSDIDSEGIRLATGGMDGVIKIWRVAGLFESFEEQTGNSNLLASMSRHNGSVLCVRWSILGQLASSSDDTIILIWQLDSRPITLRGNLEGLNDEGQVVENYKVAKRLIGHQSDTVGIEWSPNGRILSSCSLDGTICFWNPDPNSPQSLLVKIERAHAGFIKGLAWDPSGKFLASQSDDGSCVVWNVESLINSQTAKGSPFILEPSEVGMFKESVLEKIFVNMSKMTFFHRPGWSPDGALLALANATNRQLPVVALIERNNWQGPGTFFVGHLGPVEAVKFNPRLFKSLSNENVEIKNDKKIMICAVAGQDGQVSLWSSAQATPLLVLQDLFEHSVMDLAWSPDGLILVAVSYDGSAVAVKIDVTDLGLLMINDSEQAEHLKNVFGNRFSTLASDSVKEYVESVKVIECLRENEEFLSNKGGINGETLNPIIEFNGTFDKNVISNELSEPAVELPVSCSATVSTAISINANIIKTPTMIVNGKKRITPQLLTSSAGISSFSNFGNTNTNNNSISSAGSQPRGIMSTGVRLRDEDFLIHRKLLERTGAILLSGKAKFNNSIEVFVDDNINSDETVPDNLSVSIVGSSSLFSMSVEIINNRNSDGSGRKTKASALIQFVQSSQIIWKERFRGTVYLATGCRKFLAFAMQSTDLSVGLTSGNCGNISGTLKHFLLILTTSGRRYFPLIYLDSKAIHLNISSDNVNLSLITQNGIIQVWNLRECKILFSDASIVNFINSPLPVNLLSFDSKALELVLSNSSERSNLTVNINKTPTILKFIYNSSLATWICSDKNTKFTNEIVSKSAFIVDLMAREEMIENLKVSLLPSDENSNSSLQISISELEFELSIIFINLRNGKVFESNQEFLHFEKILAIYALKLGKEGRVLKAQELIEDLKELKMEELIIKLLKPFFSFSISNAQSSFSSTWQDFLSKTF